MKREREFAGNCIWQTKFAFAYCCCCCVTHNKLWVISFDNQKQLLPTLSFSLSLSHCMFVSWKLAFHWLVVATLNALCSLAHALSLSLFVLSELCLSLLLPSLERQRVLFKPLMQPVHVCVCVTQHNSLCAAAHVCTSVCVCVHAIVWRLNYRRGQVEQHSLPTSGSLWKFRNFVMSSNCKGGGREDHEE